MKVHQRGRIEIIAAHAKAVTVHHGLSETFDADGSPQRAGHMMHRDRDFFDARPQRWQATCAGAYFLTDGALGIVMAEAFLDDRYLEVLDAASQRLRVRMHLGRLDSRVVAVVARDDLQQ